MRNTESFVQVQVTDICAEDPWLGESNESIQIGAIDIHLSATFVNDATDFRNSVFKDSVS